MTRYRSRVKTGVIRLKPNVWELITNLGSGYRGEITFFYRKGYVIYCPQWNFGTMQAEAYQTDPPKMEEL